MARTHRAWPGYRSGYARTSRLHGQPRSGREREVRCQIMARISARTGHGSDGDRLDPCGHSVPSQNEARMADPPDRQRGGRPCAGLDCRWAASRRGRPCGGSRCGHIPGSKRFWFSLIDVALPAPGPVSGPVSGAMHSRPCCTRAISLWDTTRSSAIACGSVCRVRQNCQGYVSI
jgi:hypothetical protein